MPRFDARLGAPLRRPWRVAGGFVSRKQQEQRRWVGLGCVGFGGSRGSAGVWRIGRLRRPASDGRAQHIRVLLAPYPRTTPSFGAYRARLRSWGGFLAYLPSFRLCLPRRAGLAPLPLPRCRSGAAGQAPLYERPGPEGSLSQIEATTSTSPEDVVPWGLAQAGQGWPALARRSHGRRSRAMRQTPRVRRPRRKPRLFACCGPGRCRGTFAVGAPSPRPEAFPGNRPHPPQPMENRDESAAVRVGLR